MNDNLNVLPEASVPEFKEVNTNNTVRKTVPEYKLIKLYQEIISRASKLGITINTDGSSFVLSHGAAKWPAKRMQSLYDISIFLEGAESQKMTQSPVVS